MLHNAFYVSGKRGLGEIYGVDGGEAPLVFVNSRFLS